MDDIGLMAIVDTREDRLHKNGAITFVEFSASEDLVKKLSTFAYFCNEVIPLFIFEELVHFDNVWMVLYGKKHCD